MPAPGPIPVVACARYGERVEANRGAAAPSERARRPEHPLALPTLAAVAAGGAVGTLLRAAADAALPHAPTGFAAPTLLVNVIGAAVLGVLVGWASPRVPGWARAGLGSGVLGAFTTYSAFAVSVVLLADGRSLEAAVASVALTLALGLSAAAAGLVVGRRLAGSARSTDPWPEEDE